ncbi:unnamed protein product [Paramecium sonneborni]|uniref:Tetratricopeptide repeat protein n=1 Tax=Paramecium sonneborni TaxID=65129 RepID=A0A8S1RT47_9CILI|nr:unnamed protein product [Paramecium sonneborni]
MRSPFLDQKKIDQKWKQYKGINSHNCVIKLDIPELTFNKDELTKNYVQNLLDYYEKEFQLNQSSKKQIEAEKIFKQLNQYGLDVMEKFECYEQCEQIFSWIINHKSYLQIPTQIYLAHRNISNLYMKKGNPQQAINALEKALNLTSDCGIKNLRAKTLMRIASIYNKMYMYQKVFQALNEALELSSRDFDPDKQETGIQLIEAYFKCASQLEQLNQMREAMKQYQKGLEIKNKYIDDSNLQDKDFQNKCQRAQQSLNALQYGATILQKEENNDEINQLNKDKEFQYQNSNKIKKNIHNLAPKNNKQQRFLKCIKEFLDCAEYIEVEVINKLSDQVDTLLEQHQGLPIKIKLKGYHIIKGKNQVKQNSNIYQLIGQEENNISQQEQMIYLQSIIIKKFLKEAVQNNIKLNINQELFQYLINPLKTQEKQEQKKADEFFLKFKIKLDRFIILTVNFDSDDEITKIYRLLCQDEIQKKLIQQLKIKKLDLLLPSNISLEDFNNLYVLENQALELKYTSNQIILICQQKEKLNIKLLQEQLNDFVQKYNKFELIKEQFEIDLASLPDNNYIEKQVKQLQDQEEWLEIIISHPSLLIGNKKMFFVGVTIQIWIQEEKMKNEEDIVEKISRLKNDIMLIFFPIKQIVVTDKFKIMLWEQFLNQFYMNNLLGCWTIHKNPSLMIIELQGEIVMINDKYRQILSDLNEFSCEKFSFNCQEQIIKILNKKQKFDNLYKSILANIANQFGKCLIKISGVNLMESTILVSIFYHEQTDLQLIKQQLYEQFFEQLNFHSQKNFEIEDLWQFLGMEKQIFLDQHKIIVSKMNKEYYFIGLNMNLMEIKKLLIEIEKQNSENQIINIIDCPKILIFNRLKQQFLETELLQNEYVSNVYVNYSQEFKIILRAKDQLELDEKQNKICERIKQLENQTVIKICRLQAKQIKYFEKHLRSFYKELEKQNDVIFEFYKKFSYQILSQLECDNKKIQVVSTDITLIECDAIVNFSHYIVGQTQKLNQQILDFGGQAYQRYIENIMNDNQQSNQIEVTVFQLSQFRHIRYIINAFITSDINKNQAQYEQKLKKNIEAIFDKIENNNYHIQTLVIPILNMEDKESQINDYVTNIFLNCIINRFFQCNNLIKTIIINQPNYLSIDQLNLNFQRTLSGQQQNAKFQWQWKSETNFENYPLDINLQIDKGYSKFLESNQEIAVALNYKITSLPGTHFVDLQNFTIQELSSGQQSKLTFKNINNNKKYFINYEQVKNSLNDYFLSQEQNQNYQFQIFWKKLAVFFTTEGVYQINRKTNYKREIQKYPFIYEDNILVNQNYIFKTKINQKIENTNSFLIQSFDRKVNEKVLKEIKTELQKHLINYNLQIPHIGDQDFEKFQKFLDSVTQRYHGNINKGQSIQIEIFKNKEQKVQAQIESIKSYVKQYPKKWIKQSENFIKVPLQQNSKEFTKIQKNFQKTDD